MELYIILVFGSLDSGEKFFPFTSLQPRTKHFVEF